METVESTSSLLSGPGRAGGSPAASPPPPPAGAGKIRYPATYVAGVNVHAAVSPSPAPPPPPPHYAYHPNNNWPGPPPAGQEQPVEAYPPPPGGAPTSPGAHPDKETLLMRFSRNKLAKFESESNLLLAVSALIITLSFAAVLQPPGGIATTTSDDSTPTTAGAPANDASSAPARKVGQANLVGESLSFWVFFIANGSAMAAASLAVLIVVSCPPRKDVQAFVIVMLGKTLVWLAIQCSLAAFCASVWIIVGREKYKVLPFFVAAGLLYVCFTLVFVCGRMVRAAARKAKVKLRRRGGLGWSGSAGGGGGGGGRGGYSRRAWSERGRKLYVKLHPSRAGDPVPPV